MKKKYLMVCLISWIVFFQFCQSNQIRKDLAEARKGQAEALHAVKICEIRESIRKVFLAGIINNIVVVCDGTLKGGKIVGYSVNKDRREFAFGRIGQGPGEFLYLFRSGVQLYPKHIAVSSPGKKSYFNYHGGLAREDKVPPQYIPLTPFGKYFVAMEWAWPDDDNSGVGHESRKIVLLDNKFNKIKELLSRDLKSYSRFNKKTGRIDVFYFTDDLKFRINSGKLYSGYQDDHGIEIIFFDSGGSSEKKLDIFFKKKKLSEEIKNLIKDVDFEKQADWGAGIKRDVRFFEYETPVLNFWVGDNRIYLLLIPENAKQRILILDLYGKLIGTRDIILQMNEIDDFKRKITGEEFYFKDDILYYLMDEDTNDDGNTLELWAYKMK